MSHLDLKEPEIKFRKANRGPVFVAVGVLLAGVVAGAMIGYEKLRDRGAGSGDIDQTNEDVLGETEIQIDETGMMETEEGTVSGRDIQIEPETVAAPPPVPAKAPPPPPVDVCVVASDELNDKLAQAEQKYAASNIAAKQVLDTELADLDIQLTVYKKQRNDSVNNYLTSIAIATSKYNSSSEEGAYEVYQQEQAQALNNYTTLITAIAQNEQPLLDEKEASQARYQQATAENLNARDQAVSSSQHEYSAQIEGHSCRGG